jgi:hypothetical protein
MFKHDRSWPVGDIVNRWKRSLSSLGRALSAAARMTIHGRTCERADDPSAAFESVEPTLNSSRW